MKSDPWLPAASSGPCSPIATWKFADNRPDHSAYHRCTTGRRDYRSGGSWTCPGTRRQRPRRACSRCRCPGTDRTGTRGGRAGVVAISEGRRPVGPRSRHRGLGNQKKANVDRKDVRLAMAAAMIDPSPHVREMGNLCLLGDGGEFTGLVAGPAHRPRCTPRAAAQALARSAPWQRRLLMSLRRAGSTPMRPFPMRPSGAAKPWGRCDARIGPGKPPEGTASVFDQRSQTVDALGISHAMYLR